MAIRKNIVINVYGVDIELNDCTIRVSSISGDKSSMGIVTTTRNNDEIFICDNSYVFTPELNSINFIEQAYNYLKTLDEYSYAVDC